MIIHYKDIFDELQFKLGNHLKYSEDYTFIPFKVKKFTNYSDFVIQTPKLYVPYGIQESDKSKNYIMISFQNVQNDIHTQQFMDNLRSIYTLVREHFNEDFVVNHFFKDYKQNLTMTLKQGDNTPIYDSLQHVREDIPLYSYCSFIIHLAGLWVNKNQVWFQWYNLQSRIENDIILSDYAFKDYKVSSSYQPSHHLGPLQTQPQLSQPPPPPPPPPPPSISRPVKDKYSKMLSMGIPKEAVLIQKQLDTTPTISASMLQSVTLKKGKPIPKKKLKTDMNGFEPPSLDDLKSALSNLRKSIN